MVCSYNKGDVAKKLNPPFENPAYGPDGNDLPTRFALADIPDEKLRIYKIVALAK